MIYDAEASVRKLLLACSRELGGGGDHYFKLTARRQRTKEIRQVQVIPWVISDSNYVRAPSNRLDPKKTVFVGALHGMVTAEILSLIMNDLFGNVVYAGIDTDKYKYPIGSGRVTFAARDSYYRAIHAAHVEIKTVKFAKRVQIDPFLEDAVCSLCQGVQGPYFCRDMACFKYFCRPCWQVPSSSFLLLLLLLLMVVMVQKQHGVLDLFRHHKPLQRNTRRGSEASTPVGGQGEEEAVEGGTVIGRTLVGRTPPPLPSTPPLSPLPVTAIGPPKASPRMAGGASLYDSVKSPLLSLFMPSRTEGLPLMPSVGWLRDRVGLQMVRQFDPHLQSHLAPEPINRRHE